MKHMNVLNPSSPPSSIPTIAAEALSSPELAPNQQMVPINEAAFRHLARRSGSMHLIYDEFSVRDDALELLIESGAKVVTGSRYVQGKLGSIVAEWKGQPIYLLVRTPDSADLMTAAASHAEALKLHVEIGELIRRRKQLASMDIDIRFWHEASVGNAVFTTKSITVQPMQEVAATLSDPPAKALIELAQFGWMRGGIHVWHGPPGCGKTTALQSLAHAWRDHMIPEVVLDPEVLLSGTQYLMQLLDSPEHPRLKDMGVRNPRRFIVLEDAGEFVGIDARTHAGSGISRLLNMTDGMFGHNEAPVVIITTNEPVKKLHPAIMRPGRCRSIVEFGTVPIERAQEWLIKRGHTATPLESEMSIAELVALSESSAPIGAKAARKVGFGA